MFWRAGCCLSCPTNMTFHSAVSWLQGSVLGKVSVSIFDNMKQLPTPLPGDEEKSLSLGSFLTGTRSHPAGSLLGPTLHF